MYTKFAYLSLKTIIKVKKVFIAINPEHLVRMSDTYETIIHLL